MTAAIPFGPGASINLRNLNGTGAVASLVGTWTALPGTTGTTVVLRGHRAGAATITFGGFTGSISVASPGVGINNVPNDAMYIGYDREPRSGSYGSIGASVLIAGDCNGLQLGGILSTDARFGGTVDNIFGGINGPLSRDDVGVLFDFWPGDTRQQDWCRDLIQNVAGYIQPQSRWTHSHKLATGPTCGCSPARSPRFRLFGI